jgi:hypothetical protein
MRVWKGIQVMLVGYNTGLSYVLHGLNNHYIALVQTF